MVFEIDGGYLGAYVGYLEYRYGWPYIQFRCYDGVTAEIDARYAIVVCPD